MTKVNADEWKYWIALIMFQGVEEVLFLATSYPIDNPIYDCVHPEFNLTD